MTKYYITLFSIIILLFTTCKEESNKSNQMKIESINKTIDNHKKDSLTKNDSIHDNLNQQSTEPEKIEPPKKITLNEKKLKTKHDKTNSNKVDKRNRIDEKGNNIGVNEQSIKEYSITKSAIYPGCENETSPNTCLSRKISQYISDELQDYVNYLADNSSGTIRARLIFNINSEGKIVNITTEGDKELGNEIVKALNRISERQAKSGLSIQPALDINSNPISSKYIIPIRINIE